MAPPEDKWKLFEAFNLETTYDCKKDTLHVTVYVPAPFANEVVGIEKAWGVGSVGGPT